MGIKAFKVRLYQMVSSFPGPIYRGTKTNKYLSGEFNESVFFNQHFAISISVFIFDIEY